MTRTLTHIRPSLDNTFDVLVGTKELQNQKRFTLHTNLFIPRSGFFNMSSPTQPESPPTTSPNLSPTTSPRLGPATTKQDIDSLNKRSSPTKAPKSPSPAKAKFEHIANKVGISVSSERRDPNDGNTGASPPSKKRWRDIWMGSSKKEGCKDDSVGGAAPPTH